MFMRIIESLKPIRILKDRLSNALTELDVRSIKLGESYDKVLKLEDSIISLQRACEAIRADRGALEEANDVREAMIQRLSNTIDDTVGREELLKDELIQKTARLDWMYKDFAALATEHEELKEKNQQLEESNKAQASAIAYINDFTSGDWSSSGIEGWPDGC